MESSAAWCTSAAAPTEHGGSSAYWLYRRPLLDTAAAPHVLLLSGIATTHRMWESVVMRLCVTEGMFVMAVDHRGCGASPKTAASISIALMARDAAKALEHAGWWPATRTHVLGISMGGMIAQELALLRPEGIASLTLASTSAGGATPLWSLPSCRGLWSMARASAHAGDPEKVLEATCPMLWTDDVIRARREDLVAHLRRTASIMAPVPRDVVRAHGVAIMRHDTRARLAGLREAGVRAQVLVGDADAMISPSASRAMAEKLRCPLHVHRGAGHELAVGTDDPEWLFSHVVPFIRNLAWFEGCELDSEKVFEFIGREQTVGEVLCSFARKYDTVHVMHRHRDGIHAVQAATCGAPGTGKTRIADFVASLSSLDPEKLRQLARSAPTERRADLSDEFCTTVRAWVPLAMTFNGSTPFQQQESDLSVFITACALRLYLFKHRGLQWESLLAWALWSGFECTLARAIEVIALHHAHERPTERPVSLVICTDEIVRADGYPTPRFHDNASRSTLFSRYRARKAGSDPSPSCELCVANALYRMTEDEPGWDWSRMLMFHANWEVLQASDSPCPCPALWPALRDLALLASAGCSSPLPAPLAAPRPARGGGPVRRLLLALAWLVARCGLWSRHVAGRWRAVAEAPGASPALQPLRRPLPPDTSLAHEGAAAAAAVESLAAHAAALRRLRAWPSQRTWGPVLQAEVRALRAEASEVANLLDCYAKQVHAATRVCRHSMSEVYLMREPRAVDDGMRRAAQAREMEETWKATEAAFWRWMETVVELQEKETPAAPAESAAKPEATWEALVELHAQTSQVTGLQGLADEPSYESVLSAAVERPSRSHRWCVYAMPEEPPEAGRLAVPKHQPRPPSDCAKEVARLQSLAESARSELALARARRAQRLSEIAEELVGSGVVAISPLS
eukprot:m51a1_g13156 hypothetical protein (916) ;mRNA; f:29987-37745